MSLFDLKGFHAFFIVTALAMLGLVFWWAASGALRGEDSGRAAVAAASFLGFAAGLPYLGWYAKKARTLR